jgi:hypothetical protein
VLLELELLQPVLLLVQELLLLEPVLLPLVLELLF